MLSEIGISQKESSGNGVLRHRDTSRKRPSDSTQRVFEDDISKQLVRSSRGSPTESKSPSNVLGSWKKNRTARKDGGAKKWENANSEVLQSENGKINLAVFSLGSLVWAKRDDGLWWPAEVSNSEDITTSTYKPRNGNQVLVKFFGLEQSDSHPLLSYLDLESVLFYAEHRQDFLEQTFVVPEEAAKFKAAVAQVNDIYANTSGEIFTEAVKSTDLTLKEVEMQESSRKGGRKVSGSGKKRRDKEEVVTEESPKNDETKKARKRRRESNEIQTENGIDTEEVLELPSDDTHIHSSSKKRKVSTVHRLTNKENSGKRDNRKRLQDKTRGDDGYFFECVVCDMGGNLLCCDNCPRTYHLECLDPPLKRTPPGKWHCPSCREVIPPAKISIPRVSEPRRSRSMKHIEESHAAVDSQDSLKEPMNEKNILKIMDAPNVSPKDPVSETNENTSLGLPTRKKSKKTKDILKTIDAENDFSKDPVSETNNNTSLEPPTRKESKKKKNILKTSDAQIDSPKDTVSETNENTSVEPPTRKKSKKKSERKKSQDDVMDTIASPATKVCTQCGSRLENAGTSNADLTLCIQCQKSGSIETESSHVKEAEEILNSNTEPEKPLVESSACAEPIDEMKENINKEKSESFNKENNESSNKKENIESSNKENSESCNTKALMAPEILEVDRIFGCRSICKVELPNLNNECSSEPKGIQTQGVLEDGSNSGAEAATVGLISTENGVEQGSNSISECLPKIQSDSSEKVSGDAECATKPSFDIPPKNDTDDAVSRDQENDAVGIEEDELLDSQKDPDSSGNELEFLVKWVGKSHIHDKWVKESELKVLAKRKLDNYKFKHGCISINLVDEKWCKPQRIIARRNGKDDKDEVLVKWYGLSYDECTWERLEEPVIQKHVGLLESFMHFESVALRTEQHQIPAVDKQSIDIRTLSEQPSYVKGGSLFPHQMEALNWLRKCWGRRKNVILADEMGLGKTISASVFLCSLYEEFKVNAPCLVLVPLSTMPNWMAEFSLWAPQLNVVEYHGGAKARANIRQYEWHAGGASTNKKEVRSYKFNVLVTTYEMIIADSSQLRNVPWEVLIVDEGHRLKNTGSKLVQLLNTFTFSQRVLLTGTPLQNNLGEMHNLLKFLQLDTFPSMDAFEEKYNCLSTAEQVEELKKLVAPHMLRRLKKDAMQNIPPKTEKIVPVELSSLQAEYYRALLTRNYQVLRQAGKPNQHQSLVNIVVQLRKVCNHPYLIPGTEPESGSAEFLHEMRIKASAKLTLLHAMLRILKEKGHRVLVFSQMTRLLDILEDYLTTEFGSHTFERVDGSISVGERQAAISRFNQDTSRFVFLLSTRACGLGINLATADTVIIYDSDFNPHADIQAMNRAHRIGQSKRLIVYRLVVRASVEERILQLAKKKLMLDHLFANKSGSQKEVEDILRWGTEELFQDCPALGEGASNVPHVEDTNEQDGKQKKKSGGLGDVYEDTCHKIGRPKILWDDAAVARLLDRSVASAEVTESEAEGDMLGSLKAWDWNDGDTTEDQDASESGVKEKDSESLDGNIPTGHGAEEESSWDKILRTRWEKLQTEEEGALGRGKRMRKAISYKENFSAAVAEASYESGNEEEEAEAEAEYTPAGRALKNKLARLRARQKERIAARYNKESVGSTPPFHAAQFPLGKESQNMLHLPSGSSFLPVQIPSHELHPMFPSPAHGANFLALNANQSSKGENVPGISTRVTLPDVSAKLAIDLHINQLKQADCILKEKSAALASSNSLFIASSSGDGSSLSNPLFHGSSVGVQTGQSSIDVRAGNHSKLPMPQTSLQNLDPFIGEVNPFGTGSLATSLGLGISSGTNLDHSLALRQSESAIKLMNSSAEVSASLSKILNSATLGNVSSSKLETDLGYGSAGPSFLQKDEKKGKVFPFLPYLGGIMPATHVAESPPMAWSEEELDTLWSGVRRHGRGNWVMMLQDPKLHFLKHRTVKDLAERWHEEQSKMFGGHQDQLDNTIAGDGNKHLLGPFGAGLPMPLLPSQGLPGGNPKDIVNSSSFGQTREMPKFDLEGLYHRGLKEGNLSLPGAGHMGADVRSRLTHFSTVAAGSMSSPKDDINKMDFAHKIDLTSLGQPKNVVQPEKQNVQRSMPQSNTLPRLFSRNLTDSLSTAGLSGSTVGDGEWRFSNLQLRFDKGLASTQLEPLELPKFQNLPDRLPDGLQGIPQFKLNLDLPGLEKVPEMKGHGLPQISSLSKPKMTKEKLRTGSATTNNEDIPGKSSSSSLPHWLREAFKPPAPVERQELPPTIAAISHAIDLAYRSCKPTLPPWINPGPPPVAPHRKAKKRRKRKKGIEFGSRIMADVRSNSRDQVASLMLPKVGKQNQFPLLSLGSGLLENSLLSSDRRPSSFLSNGPHFTSFPWTMGQSLDLCDSGNRRLDTEFHSPFPSIGSLPIPSSSLSEGLKLPPLPSPFVPLGQFSNSDLAFDTLFPKGKKLLDKKGFQQRWPFVGCSSNDSLPTVSELKSPCMILDRVSVDIDLSRRKDKSLSTKSGDSSSKTHSDGGQSNNNDDASSEQTVSDSKANAE